MATVSFVRSRTYPVGVAEALDAVLPAPLPRLFSRRFGPLPAVREVRDQRGAWGSVGQTRTIVLADRGTMRETLTSVSRPDHFAYRIDGVTGALGRLVSEVDGRWAFEPAGTGVRITWSWELTPISAGTARVLPVLGRFWQGYARQALEQIEDLLLPRTRD